MTAIRTNNAAFDDWTDSKWTRIEELYDEIDLETRRDVPDPNALGIRYVDIEYIYREIDAREVDNRRQNVALLTEHQKVGLEVLETAAKLEPFAYAAWSVNLLNPDEPDTGFDVSSGRQTGRRLSPKARIRSELSLAPERAGRLRMWDRSRRLRAGRVNPSQRP